MTALCRNVLGGASWSDVSPHTVACAPPRGLVWQPEPTGVLSLVWGWHTENNGELNVNVVGFSCPNSFLNICPKCLRWGFACEHYLFDLLHTKAIYNFEFGNIWWILYELFMYTLYSHIILNLLIGLIWTQ